MRLPSAVAYVAILTIVPVGIGVIAGSGLSLATPGSHGDLLLDWATADNTDVSVGTIDSGCQEVLSSAGNVRIDVVAVNANDWAGMDFVFIYSNPIVVDRPGPGDGGVDANPDFGDAAAGFDFVPFDEVNTSTFGSQNFMTTATASSLDYSTTDGVPDGSSNPHGISLFDNALVGESGDGGIARISLNTTGLLPGVYTLSLGITGEFGGGVHSDATGFLPDNLGSVQMAVDQSCTSTPATPTPATSGPGATPMPTPGPGTAIPAVGGAPGDGGGGNGWPIVAFIIGGVLLGVAAAGAIAQRLRRRTGKTQQS